MTARAILPIADPATTTRRAWRLLRRHRRPLVGSVLLFALVGLSGVVPPYVLGTIVDLVQDGTGSRGQVLALAAVIVVSALVGGAATAASAALLARAANPALAELREDVLDRALHQDAERLEQAGTGDVMSRVGDDVRAISESLDNAVPEFVRAVVAIVFTMFGLLVLDWRLALAGLAAGPFYLVALRWYLPRSAPYYRRERIAQGERAEALMAGIHGAPTLRALGRHHLALQRIDHHSRAALVQAVDVYALLTRLFGRINLAEWVGLTAVLVTGFLLVRDDAVTVGAATAAALYFHRLFNPIGAVLLIFDQIQAAGASLARLVGVLELPEPRPSSEVVLRQPVLRLTGVAHRYGDGPDVVRDVDLTIAPGEHVAVVGSTGAGKTTLASIVAGQVIPSHGEVTVAGRPYGAIPSVDLRRALALVSQEVHVFATTVRENVAMSRPELSDDDVWAALRVARCAGWVAALPDGLQTRVGHLGHPLSAAQGQQLALARVAAHDPSIVVLDEATAEAGSSGARDLDLAARAVLEGRSALIVAHRLSQARYADRILVMEHGRIVEDGTHDALVARAGRYAQLWSAWSAR
ncbi:ABC transporter ATP-binding protein [Aeromicrobium phragmitis]|uniref:ABC transporter ATP-binding protein n=1 Tax=Aeromicrobium phragmitis TaxID=2478914 RepID=A0A3L8PN22_9ACTN|nr:ABC transporter ATP-binding protein [Aeromicrobium phragmitis]RLV56797.1 ABC transporter ATP-binding protein [Aeromicrobium phragmitis]